MCPRLPLGPGPRREAVLAPSRTTPARNRNRLVVRLTTAALLCLVGFPPPAAVPSFCGTGAVFPALDARCTRHLFLSSAGMQPDIVV